MDLRILESAGLSKNESQVYLALVKLGSASVSKIAQFSEVHRVNIYDTLERLQKKGLVSSVVKSNKKYYEAASPERIKELLIKKEDEMKKAKNSLPDLMGLYSNSKNRQEIHSFKGLQGVKTVMKEVLEDKPKEILNFGSTGGLFKMSPINFDIWESQREKSKIPMRVLTSGIMKKALKKRKGQEIRGLSNDFISLSSTLVYGNKIAILLWAEEPLAIVIESSEISQSYRNYFNMLWKTAKE